jgi:hypothetical protein
MTQPANCTPSPESNVESYIFVGQIFERHINARRATGMLLRVSRLLLRESFRSSVFPGLAKLSATDLAGKLAER